MRTFRVGFIVGRFQHIHVGHERVINTALEVCDKVLVLVGSSQESGTERNPFKAETRRELVETVYASEVHRQRLITGLLPDMTDENDINADWGRYVLRHVRDIIGEPDVMLYGNDENRAGWYAPEDVSYMAQIIIPRKTFAISATELRKFMVDDNYESWQLYAHPSIRNRYEELRTELLKIPFYKEAAQ